ncbi:MAG: cytochrome c biogenesis protein CcsA [Lutibacter sp.]|nr:cytochrome c biogenesis protein CcsA [Lutibacter sp.]
MNKILNFLISSKATLIFLLIFTVAMATGTFIEEKYDTVTAKILIYNATWFEITLLLLAINFIGSIKRFNLLRFGRIPGLLFHISFIIILIGAGITRYIGFEGSMHIREGESSNFIYSANPYINVNAYENDLKYAVTQQLLFGMNTDNSFEIKIDTKEKGPLKIKYKNYLRNVVESFEEVAEGGIRIIELTFSVDGHNDVLQLKDGEIKETHGFHVAYNNPKRSDILNISDLNGKLFFKYPGEIKSSKIDELKAQEVPKDSSTELLPTYSYALEQAKMSFKLTNQYKNAITKYVESDVENSGPDALILDVSYNGKNQEVPILGGMGYLDNFHNISLDGIDVQISYGLKKISLPFEIKLNKFILERYAGSNSPSSYASEVTVIDKKKKVVENHRIYMNNILDYNGYRFFQSSYDRDEKGTVLSVNKDFYGTLITYIGYFLLFLGFILTLFNKNSRFSDLVKKIKNTREKRKNLIAIIFFVFLCTSTSFSQNNTSASIISYEHATKFGHLITQTYDGRFAPVNTLAYDVMHKISKKDKFKIEGKGSMDAIQVFLDLTLNPEFWKQQKIIYVREKSVMSIIGKDGKYAAFNDFFNPNGSYKLKLVAEAAFIKKPAEQNTFDKEIIKLNERLEIFMQAYQGNLLKLYPVQNSANNKWINWNDPLALTPLVGSITALNSSLQLQSFNYKNIMLYYLSELRKASKTGVYSEADRLLGYIENIQRQSNAADLLPSRKKIKKEVEYTKSKMFINLKNIYALLSILLLGFSFVDNLLRKRNNIVYYSLNTLILFLGIAFLYHTYGMGLRWYLSGHAPWSNGYEALILISWSSILAGFCFIRYSKITLAATALLAFFTLMTASHSSYDPQLTNLQPVLKSYWLIIHVATLTISYGFLGLGFVLGLFNLLIYLFKNTKNAKRFNLIITELTHINEMNLTIGLFLATVGTFLGGIWANESWGRYWGWDAKETWALVIIIVYSIILHFRLVPKMKSFYIFNVGAVIGFGSVLMTFFGVNYYLSKGMHSYASGETPIFPLWAWIVIISILTIIIAAGIKERISKNKSLTNN